MRSKVDARALVRELRAKGYPVKLRKNKTIRFGPGITIDDLPALRLLYPPLAKCSIQIDIPEQDGISITNHE